MQQQGVNVKKTLPLERKQAHTCWMMFSPQLTVAHLPCACAVHFGSMNLTTSSTLQATPKMLTASLVLQLYLGNSNLIFPLG